MQKDQTSIIQCIRLQSHSHSIRNEIIATEMALTLLVDGKQVTSFSYSPGLEKELILGYLLSSGIINDLTEVDEVEISDSICSISKTSSKSTINKAKDRILNQIEFKTLVTIRESLRGIQENHKATRGFHGAIIWEYSTGKWFACEDIGRYNAVDKVIGHFTLTHKSLKNSILLLSGRLTENIVTKCKNAGIPVVASMTVATDRAIENARMSHMTLIGGLVEESAWLYNEGDVSISFV